MKKRKYSGVFPTDVLEWGQKCSNFESTNDVNDNDTNDMLNILERKSYRTKNLNSKANGNFYFV
jgi:hypothetical protein